MSFPFVSIVGTTECDAHCRFCERWREPILTMDADLTCRLIRQLPRIGTRVVDITGGQPGLWDGLGIVLRECRRQRLKTTVTVSGPSALRIVDDVSYIDYLRVSIHGSENEHDRFQGDGFYQANLYFLTAITKISSSRPAELIFTVREECTESDFWAVNQLAHRFGIRVIGNIEWGIGVSPRLLALIHAFRKKPYWVFSLAKIRYWQRGGNNRSNPTCAADKMLVLHNNSIVQPCMELRDLLPAISLDHKSDLHSILRAPERISWHKMTGRWEACHGCTISCPNMLGLATKCLRRYASWLHLPTLVQRPRDGVLLGAKRFLD